MSSRATTTFNLPRALQDTSSLLEIWKKAESAYWQKGETDFGEIKFQALPKNVEARSIQSPDYIIYSLLFLQRNRGDHPVWKEQHIHSLLFHESLHYQQAPKKSYIYAAENWDKYYLQQHEAEVYRLTLAFSQWRLSTLPPAVYPAASGCLLDDLSNAPLGQLARNRHFKTGYAQGFSYFRLRSDPLPRYSWLPHLCHDARIACAPGNLARLPEIDCAAVKSRPKAEILAYLSSGSIAWPAPAEKSGNSNTL